jgi:chromate reductase, NAD(P)H dehydrogenase (quinone)
MALGVVAICGSLRKGSYNRMLMNNAFERAPEGLVFEEVSFRGWPVYDGDMEATAYPAEISDAKERIGRADGLLLVTPEYNFSVPGPLKNAVDWLSRPADDSPLLGKPVGTIGAATGWAGTERAQLVWMYTFRFLHMPQFPDYAVHVSGAAKAFDEHGKLVTELFVNDLDAYLAKFREWLEGLERAKG